MMTTPHSKRLSDFPYLLAAVLQLGVFQKSVPMALAQKAHRLINKHAYKAEDLERAAFKCFSFAIGDELEPEDYVLKGETAVSTASYEFFKDFSLMWAVTNGGMALLDALDQKDADIGNLRDFLAHVQSSDE